MSGYANRNRPSEGKIHDLWAKALAIEDSKGGRVVIVTTDLIGLPRVISDEIGARVAKDYRLERSRLLLNSSHTHTGPLLRANLETMFDLKPDEIETVRDYSRKLADDLVQLVGAAIQDLAPANLAFGNGTVGFAEEPPRKLTQGCQDRRQSKGPVDHDVPVLQVPRRTESFAP